MSIVTCIMPTANRRRFVPSAIQMFLGQDYADKELVIIDDGTDEISDIIPSDPRIRYYREEPRRRTLGGKRNLACDLASGEVILHWDDDDWYAPWRVRYQAESLLSADLDLNGLNRAYFVDARAEEAWEYGQMHGISGWLCGATLGFRKALWQSRPFPDVRIGEDNRFVSAARRARVGALEDNRCFVARIHDANTCSKRPRGRWPARSIDTIRSIMGTDWEQYFGGENGLPFVAPHLKTGTALITAASGIGDIVRVTPLIRAAHRLGYEVDVLVAPDDPATSDILRDAPEIRTLFTCEGRQRGGAAACLPGIAEEYDVATFTGLSSWMTRRVTARRKYGFGPDWRVRGDFVSVKGLAEAIGWLGELPAPFAMKSARRFDIAPTTIAIHPGCKPNWPWKKWHGFGELASLFENVVIVGTAADLDNSRSYFTHPFTWPTHARSFVGALDLRDTAALLSQCSALVAPDSGLMHLGVALRVRTFGIFGITSPERECIVSPFMIPITKQLPCEPACRQITTPRRDCDLHRECLKTLAAEEVAARIIELQSTLSAQPTYTTETARRSPNDRLTVNYHCSEIFCRSGYAEAARGYVRALQAAGIQVRVVDKGIRPHHVDDDVVASLIGYDPAADFNLLHSVPSNRPQPADGAGKTIAMAVWEAEEVPEAWFQPLSTAADVWVPSASNVEAFERGLGKAPFRLPHVLWSAPVGPDEAQAAEPRLGVRATDWVFYSIFTWQDRKNASDLMDAFLCAFPEESDAVLVIKTDPSANGAAHRLLAQLRAERQSGGRVILHCGWFEESMIRALHARGDCYVSLHRGEGWGYPLFEAAGHGKAIVATGYGGPVDYLDSEHHWLVRHRVVQISQPYYLYTRAMHWAEPDVEHAIEGLRWVYEHRTDARARSGEAAKSLRWNYSPERIGAAAKRRLCELKFPAAGRRMHARPVAARKGTEGRRPQPLLAPRQFPITEEWYDEDYFQNGLKSNWSHSYDWSWCGDVFVRAADMLKATFPDARTFVDAGCAKGFLVRALRELGLDARGFDHSQWAIQRTENCVREYVSCQSVDDAASDAFSVDVVVAMSLLESLTEEQIRQFLPRARRWARRAIFATIAAPGQGADRDLSHINMHDRSWWDDRFADAGWRADPLQATLQQHRLGRRLGWNVYVFRPE
jgi:ADP-heptose:LPS heptosyltransferase/glycosyltransferase involved in cell wall biosynthesis